MRTLRLDAAVKEIKQACDRTVLRKEPPPFFFIVGAGISSPPVLLARDIVEHCRLEALTWGRKEEAEGTAAVDVYSHWFHSAYPQPADRQLYLRSIMEKAYISRANFRLAHLLLSGRVGQIVVTPNFDTLLSKALDLFGERHIVCDHPQTVER